MAAIAATQRIIPCSDLGFTKTGAGTLTLSGQNTYTGGTTLNAGELDLGSSSALGTGVLAMAQGTFLTFGASGLAVANAISLDGDTTVVVPTGQSQTISGVLSDSTAAGATPGRLRVANPGTLDLTAANTYTGGTTLTGSMLELGQQTLAGTGAITYRARATEALQLDATLTAGSATTFGNTLTDLGAGDTIDIRGLNSTGATAGYANGVLTVANGAGTSESFTLATPTALNFIVASDPNGGTLVTDNAEGTPTANSQADQVAFGTATPITLTGSDAEDNPAQPLTYTVTTAPAHGTLSGAAPNLTYTPTSGFYGQDSFT